MATPTTSVNLNGVIVDSVTIADISITYGRQSPLEQPSPASCTITMLTDQVLMPPAVGMALTVDCTVPSISTWKRFTGFVTSVSAGRYTTSVTATSKALGRLARINGPDYVAGSTGVGVGAAITDLLTLSGALDDPVWPQNIIADTGQTTIVPGRVITAGNVLAQCQTLAELDVYGVFWETTDGTLIFSDEDARSFPNGSIPDIFFSADPAFPNDTAVLDDWRSDTNLDGLINSVQITYGKPAVTFLMEAQDSIDQWGPYGVSEEFPVSGVDDATRRASRLLAGWAQPRTIANPITVELDKLTGGSQALLFSLAIGSTVGWAPSASSTGIPGLPEYTFIEGWTEHITGQAPNKGRHTVALYLSDVDLTRTSQKWSEVTPTKTWAAVSGTLTWYQAAGTSL